MNVNPFSLIGDKIDKKDIFVEFKGIMGADIPSLDFNDYTTNGWYENTGTNRTGSANVPHASDNGYLLVVSKSRTVYQYWYSTYQSLGTMVRARKNGTWGSWGTVALTSDIPVPQLTSNPKTGMAGGWYVVWDLSTSWATDVSLWVQVASGTHVYVWTQNTLVTLA